MRTVVLLLAGFVAWIVSPAAALAEAFFSDGYLGLTQEELRAKLGAPPGSAPGSHPKRDRKSTRLNSSHVRISYAVFCLKKKKYNIKVASHTVNHFTAMWNDG